jgi:hypothetical protein
MQKRRGIALGMTFTVVMAGGLLAFMVALASSLHLNLARAVQARTEARFAAESAVAATVERIMATPDFGTQRQSSDIEQVSITASDLCQGRVSFATSADAPYSTNNLQNHDTPTTGWERQVAHDMLHVVATGSGPQASVLVEALVHVPAFEYAIASSGRVHSPTGGLVVASATNVPAAIAALQAHDFKSLLAAHLASNATDAMAIQLGPDSLVTGMARACGGIFVSPQASVLEGVSPQADPVPVPSIPAASYDPDKSYRNVPRMAASYSTSQDFEGYNKSDGNVTINGDLHLSSGLVYVTGDLTIHGGLTGHGAIIVTGKTVLDGGAAFSSENQVALIGQGDVALSSDSAQKAFQGIVYTEGNFSATKISLLGSFVANGKAPGGSTLKVDRSALVTVPNFTRFTIMIKPPVTAVGGSRIQSHLDTTERDQGGSDNSSSGVQRVDEVVDGPVTYEVLAPNGTQLPSDPQTFYFDINQFIPFPDRLRLSLWKDR